MTIQRREIVNIIILSIITCGIYYLYWMVVTTDDFNAMDDVPQTSGMACLLLTFITCGLFGIYWNYKLGERIGKLNGNSSLALIGLLCSLFGGHIIAQAIYQDEINKYLLNN